MRYVTPRLVGDGLKETDSNLAVDLTVLSPSSTGADLVK
jgi:hypothetical protein